MRARPCRTLAVITATLSLAGAGTHALSQTQPQGQPSTPPAAACPAPSTTGACAPAASAPSARQKFPYPGSSADPDDPVAPPANATPPSAPAPSAGKQFPYPGDATSAGSSSSSSSSSGANSSTDPDDPAASDTPPSAPAGRRKLAKPARMQSDDERFTEDLKVARFYHDDGNNLASYNRLRDATRLVTDEPDAWFLLGEVSAKLGKPDESLAAYRRFLALEPDSRRARNLQREQPALRAAR